MDQNDISDELNYAVYLRIRQIMKNFGIESISSMADHCGISKSTISALQIRNQKKTVTLKTIGSICAAVGMSVSEFFDSPLFENISGKRAE